MDELIRALRRGDLSGHLGVGGRSGEADSIGGEAGLRFTTPNDYYLGGSVRGHAVNIPGHEKIINVRPGAFSLGHLGRESEQRLTFDPDAESLMLQFGFPRVDREEN